RPPRAHPISAPAHASYPLGRARGRPAPALGHGPLHAAAGFAQSRLLPTRLPLQTRVMLARGVRR
ncbi:MAG: methyltransferase, partial [bacterium]